MNLEPSFASRRLKERKIEPLNSLEHEEAQRADRTTPVVQKRSLHFGEATCQVDAVVWFQGSIRAGRTVVPRIL